MEDWKYRQILLRGQLTPLPIATERLDELVETFALPRASRVLDIGCGGGTLIRLARRYGATCTVVDAKRRDVELAQAAAVSAGVSGLVTIVEQDAFAFTAEANSFDATLCLDGTWILGGYRKTLVRMARWTRPGGLVAVAESFAFEPPEAAYFRGRNVSASAFRSHEGNIAIGEEEGLELLACWVSSDEEWNGHHEAQFLAAQNWLAANPADRDAFEVETRITAAEQGFFSHERDAQRWAAYLFRKPLTVC